MVLALLLALPVAAAAAVTGIVQDAGGGAVSGAAVLIQTPAGVQAQTVTGPDGRFSFEAAPTGTSTLIVRAGGFGEGEKPINTAGEIEITLAPATLLGTAIATPSRTEQQLGGPPALASPPVRTPL